MKSLVLRSCVLGPYVPLRLHSSESVLRMDYVCHHDFTEVKIVQIDD